MSPLLQEVNAYLLHLQGRTLILQIHQHPQRVGARPMRQATTRRQSYSGIQNSTMIIGHVEVAWVAMQLTCRQPGTHKSKMGCCVLRAHRQIRKTCHANTGCLRSIVVIPAFGTRSIGKNMLVACAYRIPRSWRSVAELSDGFSGGAASGHRRYTWSTLGLYSTLHTYHPRGERKLSLQIRRNGSSVSNSSCLAR
jgi:hypothetical protein